MLLFSVFENGQPARDWPLSQAHLLVRDDLAIPGEIELAAGVIACRKRIDGAYTQGLSVQFPVEPVMGIEPASGGLLTLRTCLLPERDRPYLLSLELARHQVMLLLNKLEEWALFDLPAEEPAIRLLERARESFHHALVVQHLSDKGNGAAYTAEAEQAAREALSLSVAAGEALAMLHARVQHQRRVSGELARVASAPLPETALTDHEARAAREALLGSPGAILPEAPLVGCTVNPSLFTNELAALIQANCDFINIPMRWVDMEPNEGKYAFAKTDRWIEWAVRTAKMPVVAGPVLNFHPRAVPEWLYIWEHDYETLRDVIFEHVKALVTRYRRTVNTWTIASGLHVSGGSAGSIALSFEQAVDLTRSCVSMVRKLQPTAKVHVEIAQPWGEYTASKGGSKSMPPSLYAELLNQFQTNVDAYGVRVQMGQSEPGRSTRDMLTMSAMLDKLAAMDRPLAVSALGAPSMPPPKQGEEERAWDPGHWRAAWSPAMQEQWLAAAAAVAAGKPYVQSICWHDLYDLADGAFDMPSGGLATQTAMAKPALAALGALRAALRAKSGKLPGAG